MSDWNFAFGSHLSTRQLSKIIGAKPSSSTRATLPGYRLTFWRVTQFPKEYGILTPGGGSPVLVPDASSKVYGVLYPVSEDVLRVLDVYEESWGYRRVRFQVESEKGWLVEAYAHNRTEPAEFMPPSDGFLDTMREGLKEHGFSIDVIKQVEKAAQAR
jgi:gamma-glutamylcyclotransferase (GGCT)/AIG2-like uncharacterized protein YtfP